MYILKNVAVAFTLVVFVILPAETLKKDRCYV